LTFLRQNEAMPVTVTSAAARPTAVLAATTTWAEYPSLWKKLLDEVHANVHWHSAGGHSGRNIMLYLDDVPHVEVGVELDQPAEISGRLIRSTLPGGEVAMAVHRGAYAELGAAHDEIREWCADQGVRLAGPRWEVYGHWFGDDSKAVTEVFYLLQDS
jgi:effector-binding domain-containing protein